ncbi:MAG: ABC transporter permease [Thermoanaerobacteraceae bacterium]|nr:ABC transporter permease [Thermoanaerobacteraceae bacterium]
MNKRLKLNRTIFIVMLLAIWEITAHSHIFPELLFPSLESILSALIHELEKGTIVLQTYNSIEMILEGMIIGDILAIIISVWAMISRRINEYVTTLVSIMDPLPGIALLPLAILWFGTGRNSIIFIIIHSVLWPMILNTVTGFKTIPKIYLEVGSNIGLKKIKIITNIMIPSALPSLLTGLQVGWSRAWRALISAEMIFGATGKESGLGWYIFEKRFMLDMPGVFAGLFIIVAIGFIVETVLFEIIEESTIKKWGMTN